MEGISIIYMVGVFAIGALAGVIIEFFIDEQIIKELQEDNRKLKLENEHLHQEDKHEVIEIIDRRTSEREISFPNTEGI